MKHEQVVKFQGCLILPKAVGAVFAASKLGLSFSLHGQDWVGVPHTEDAVRVLWNAGHKHIPSPIESDSSFNWSGPFKPMHHQFAMTGFMTVHDKLFNLSDMGTGKTAACVWAAEYLMLAKKIKRVLVLCPLSTIRTTWEREIRLLTPMRQTAIAHGGKNKRKNALDSDAQWVVMNHDGVKLEADAIKKSNFDLIICDEFTAFKTWNADRSRALRKVQKGKRLWMLSATPTAKSPLDAYFPCKLVNPSSYGTLNAFRDATMFNVNSGPFPNFKPRRGAMDTVRTVMQPAIRFNKEDIMDLPPVTYIKREVSLTQMQERLLKKLKAEQILSIRDGLQLTTATAATLATKLLQIAQGVVIDEHGDHVPLPCTPRLTELTNLVQQNSGKAIVFAPFRGVIDVLHKHMSKDFTVGVVHGGVGSTARDKIFNDFQQSDAPQVLLAHPRTTSHGLTLTAATLTVWYGPITSTETYLQANQRMNRPGQTKSMTIAQIGATADEWRIHKALAGEADMQDTLLKMYEDS